MTDPSPPAKAGSMTAFPIQASDLAGSLEPEHGLTKRELIAAMAMQGLLANLGALRREGIRDDEIEESAVMRADGLLKELAK